MSAQEAKDWADLAALAKPRPAPKPRTGLEDREPAPPGAESAEQFFERVAAARLLSEPCDG